MWWEWWAAHQRQRDGADTLRKVKAHTIATDIGIKISKTDWIDNNLADAIAKETMKRFPQDLETQNRFTKAERAVTAWAKWIGILGTLDFDDGCERPPEKLARPNRAGRRHGNARRISPHVLEWDHNAEILR